MKIDRELDRDDMTGAGFARGNETHLYPEPKSGDIERRFYIIKAGSGIILGVSLKDVALKKWVHQGAYMGEQEVHELIAELLRIKFDVQDKLDGAHDDKAA